MFNRLETFIGTGFSGNGLKALVFRGGVWLGAGSVTEQIARFGRNMILARLLAPEAFGTMAIVVSVTSVLQTFTEIGVREALIQNPRGSDSRYVNAAWWMSAFRALATYLVLFLAAPLIATFYGNAELRGLLRFAIAALLLEGTMSAKAFLTMKEMKFSKWALIHHGGGIVGVLATLILSVFIPDVWALVIGSVTESAARCALSYIFCPFLPVLRWEREALKDLFQFSRGLFGLSLLNLIFMRTDVFVLGKMLSAAQLGVYTMGVYLIQAPTGFIVNLGAQVIFPTFCRVQADRARTNRIFLQVTTAVLLVGMPALAFVVVCGPSLLSTIYGKLYSSAASAMTFAALAALINLVNTQITGIFYASGCPSLHRRCVAVMAGTVMVLTYPFASWWGAVGGQVACVIAVTAGLIAQMERIRFVTGFQLVHYIRPVLVSSVAAGFVVVASVLGRATFHPQRPVADIVLGAISLVLAYGAMAMALGQRRTAWIFSDLLGNSRGLSREEPEMAHASQALASHSDF